MLLRKDESERFAQIARETHKGYGITLKDLGWIVRLVERLDRLELKPADRQAKVEASPSKRTVNFLFVQDGDRCGVECEACGARFFDRLSKGAKPRLLESGIPVALEHAREVHKSTGGVVGVRGRLEPATPRPSLRQ